MLTSAQSMSWAEHTTLINIWRRRFPADVYGKAYKLLSLLQTFVKYNEITPISTK